MKLHKNERPLSHTLGNTARVYKDGRAFLGKKIGEVLGGTEKESELPMLCNALTLTLTREKDPDKLAHSLSIVIQDIYLKSGKRVRVHIEQMDSPKEKKE